MCRGGFQTFPRHAIKYGVVFSPAQCIHPHLYHYSGNAPPVTVRGSCRGGFQTLPRHAIKHGVVLPPPPGSAFTHTSITIQATRPWSPLVEGVGEGFKPSLGMRSNLGSHLLPRSAYSCTSITHAHAEIKGLGSSVGRRISPLPRWWTWLISATRVSNHPPPQGRG